MNTTSHRRTLVPLSLLLVSLLAVTTMARQGSLGASRLPLLTPEEKEILSHMSLVHLDDGQGGTVLTLRISGLNVQIVNGLGATNGNEASPDSIDPGLTLTNGLGNLIVGYNEPGNPLGDDRTGSHNIAFGHGNTFSSFGGLVGPRDCTISAPFASVSAGRRNRAAAAFASVTGGFQNTASGQSACVSAGTGNTASADVASVSGGGGNTAESIGASVSGGQGNRATGYYYATVSGGQGNTASGYYSTVSGGQGRSASDSYDWRAGALFQED